MERGLYDQRTFLLLLLFTIAFLPNCNDGIPPVDQTPTSVQLRIDPFSLGLCKTFFEGREEITVTTDVEFVDEDGNSIGITNFQEGAIFEVGTNT